LSDEDDYITNPRRSGYRSYHIVLKYFGTYESYAGMRIEIQLRTQLQHAWATAVEAVGLYRNEDLKGGNGDPGWLRFFELMASEIATAEDLPIVPATPECRSERLNELRDLNKRLDAFGTMEGFRRAVRDTEGYGRKPESKYYLIQYDNRAKTVSVRPYDSVVTGYSDLGREEAKSDVSNAVLVEVDKIEDLKEAYPNYFLDVAMFADGLRSVLQGGKLAIPSAVVTKQKAPSHQLASILRDWHHRRSR
jgi:hypothetical protein